MSDTLDGTGSQANLPHSRPGGLSRRRAASRGSAAAQYGWSEPVAATDDLRSQRFYHGTQADLKPGDLIEPGHPPDVAEQDRMTT